MKRKEIKIKPKKIKADSDEWVSLVKDILKNRKADFAIWKRFWKKFVKKEDFEPELEASKEVIKRMSAKKLTAEEAQQMALDGARKLQNSQKEMPRMLIFLLGGGTMVICSIIFLIIRSPKTGNIADIFKDINVLLWMVLLVVNSVIFYIGLQKRKTFSETLSVNSILTQASAAYAASKAPGKGGSLFEAFKYLDFIRQKNKESFDKKYGLKK
jgi:hypothetical protein